MQEDREPMPLKEQEDAVIEFLQGVIASFQIDASASTRMEEERIIGSIDGEDVGLLIGPKAGHFSSSGHYENGCSATRFW